jgi:hypothetical protein
MPIATINGVQSRAVLIERRRVVCMFHCFAEVSVPVQPSDVRNVP